MTAKNMLKKGMDMDTIMEITGLTKKNKELKIIIRPFLMALYINVTRKLYFSQKIDYNK